MATGLHVEREFNDVRMVCAAYLGLLANGEPGQVYNVCSGEPYTLHRVLATLQAITGHHMAVDVNPAFLRANDVHRLCGSPTKLHAAVGTLGQWALEDTLRWMFDA